MAGKLTLAASERLKSRKAIDAVFAKNKCFHVFPFKICCNMVAEPGLKAATGVSSRHFKKATDRNRIKRLTREAWRIQKNTLREMLLQKNKGLHVFILYTGKEMPVYAAIAETMLLVVQKLEKDLGKE